MPEKTLTRWLRTLFALEQCAIELTSQAGTPCLQTFKTASSRVFE